MAGSQQVDSPVRYLRGRYVHSEDLPLHRSRISAAAGDWLTAVQDAFQVRTATPDLNLILEEVVFIRAYIAYDRVVRAPRPTRNRR
jgi:hypothetical protein